jgi:cytoskeleton protein RodZ
MTVNDRNKPEAPLRHQWGARFKAAREAMNLTEKEASARLHLKPYLITVIETERFENGPPAIFMRGYIRSYGRLLNLPEKEITQALAQLNLATPTTLPPISTMQTRTIQYGNNVGWSTSLVVIVLVGLVGMWWHTHARTNFKDVVINVPTQTAPQTTTIASSHVSTRQAPADPTPNELVNPQIIASTSTLTSPNTNPAPINQAINSIAETNSTPAKAPALPTANSQQTVTSPTNPSQPATIVQNTAPETPTPEATPEKPTLAANQNDDDTDTKPIRRHREKAKLADTDIANNEMAIPEQGLDASSNESNNN